MKIQLVINTFIYTYLVTILGIFIFLLLSDNLHPDIVQKPHLWAIRSIDTMKYSRDLSRQKLDDPSFDQAIDQQVKQIASTGANYIAIDTPYDPEFLPILARWVSAARNYNLKVWFRGNMSGWEGWFDYPKIQRTDHIQRIHDFIIENPYLFKDGDIFTACPECENGGPGDPRSNGDLQGHRQFLIDEYNMTSSAFKKINKKVVSNYDPMNYDVAKLVMDKDTTKALGGVVVIDHYVSTNEELVRDIKYLSNISGGKIILGEFGAPIPDIHGVMTENQQAQFLGNAFEMLSGVKELEGLNYWTNMGSSTSLWNTDGTPKKAAGELENVFNKLNL